MAALTPFEPREMNGSDVQSRQPWSLTALCRASSLSSFLAVLLPSPLFLLHLHSTSYPFQDARAWEDPPTQTYVTSNVIS